jgi:hypothetical protein
MAGLVPAIHAPGRPCDAFQALTPPNRMDVRDKRRP